MSGKNSQHEYVYGELKTIYIYISIIWMKQSNHLFPLKVLIHSCLVTLYIQYLSFQFDLCNKTQSLPPGALLSISITDAVLTPHRTDGIAILVWHVLICAYSIAVLIWIWHTAYIYDKIRTNLDERDFIPAQYSDYMSAYPCGAYFCWYTMFTMMSIPPPGRMETTVKKLRMHSIVELGLQDVSNKVKLGGVYSRHIRGPMPLNLVTPVVQNLDPQDLPIVNPVQQHLLPPVGTRPTAMALHAYNWAA